MKATGNHTGGTATCIERAACTVCGSGLDSETITALGHTGGTNTCEKGAVCSRCGQEYGKAFGHSWNSGVVTKQPTCLATGVKTYTCTRCKGTKPETVAKLAGTVNRVAKDLKLQVKKSVLASKLITGTRPEDYIANVISANTKVLTVAKYGKNDWKLTGKAVSTKKTGTAKVTIVMESGASTDITFTVQKGVVKASSVKVNVPSNKLTLTVGQQFTLIPSASPVTISSPTPKYTTSSKKVATVSKTGVIAAKKSGKATIKVTLGGKTVKIAVTVKAVAPKDFTLNKTSLTLKKNKTFTLKAVFTPKNSEAAVTYKSLAPTIVTVSKTGKLKAKKTGTAVINVSVKCSNGKTVTKQCTVTVP